MGVRLTAMNPTIETNFQTRQNAIHEENDR